MGFVVSLQTAAACAERIVDVPGYIPIVSTLTLPFRVMIAAFETLCAFVCAFTLYYYSLKNIRKPEQINNDKYNEISCHMAYFASNAFQNIIRGLIEQFPIGGNMACGFWDWEKARFSTAELCANFGPTQKGDWHRPALSTFVEFLVRKRTAA